MHTHNIKTNLSGEIEYSYHPDVHPLTPAPTLKIATNSQLAEKKKTWIDFNAGVVADGACTLDEAGADLYRLVLDVASGKKTKAEGKGFREISIFKDGVVL